MTEIDDIEFLDRSELLTRKEIAELTGISKTKLNNICHSQFLEFPKAIGAIKREEIWNKNEVMAWLENHDIQADLPMLTRKTDNNPCKSTLDNRMANVFLTAKRAQADETND